jgi:hypothetical protein
MKRDMDLAREILLKIEDDPLFTGGMHSVSAAAFGIKGHTDEEFNYHCVQLVEAGFLDGNKNMAGHGIAMIGKLTWKGHEFLDDIRDPGVWQKTKERTKGITSVGVAFLGEIAKAEIRAKLGLP